MKKCKLLIIVLLLLCVSIVGCQSKYNTFVWQYKSEFKAIVALLDENNIQSSIKPNKLEGRLKQLDHLLDTESKDIPRNKITDFILLKMRHDILKDVIEKGARYDTLKVLDKMVTVEGVSSVKTFY